MTFTTHYSLSIIVFDPDSSGEPQRNFALHFIDELAYSHCIPRTADSCCIYLRDQSNVHLRVRIRIRVRVRVRVRARVSSMDRMELKLRL